MHAFDINNPAVRHAQPFKVPEGYFQKFTGEMMGRIHDLQKGGVVESLPFVRWIPFIGVASVAALLALFAYFVAPRSIEPASPSESAAASLTDDPAYDYLMMADADLLNAYEYDN